VSVKAPPRAFQTSFPPDFFLPAFGLSGRGAERRTDTPRSSAEGDADRYSPRLGAVRLPPLARDSRTAERSASAV
jgi:hypothetical protein